MVPEEPRLDGLTQVRVSSADEMRIKTIL